MEEAELWGDEVLQMPARRLALAASIRNDGTMRDDGETGRLGHLLFKSRRVRKAAVPWIGRNVWEVDEQAEREMLAELPAMLDRVDAWIEEGVLNGDELNAADYMIATSLALLTYRTDVEPRIASRPSAALVDRVLPGPRTGRRAVADRRGRLATSFRPWRALRLGSPRRRPSPHGSEGKWVNGEWHGC